MAPLNYRYTIPSWTCVSTKRLHINIIIGICIYTRGVYLFCSRFHIILGNEITDKAYSGDQVEKGNSESLPEEGFVQIERVKVVDFE